MELRVSVQQKLSGRTIEFMLLMSGYFLYSIRWGGENQQILLSLGWLQILVSSYAIWRFGASSRALAWLLIIFGMIGIAQLFYPYVIEGANIPGTISDYVEAAARLYFYLFFICLHALTMRQQDIDVFVQVFLQLSRLSIAIATACMFLYWMTGIPILLNFYFSEVIIRPQAFLSEPSAFAPLVGSLLVWGLLKKSRKDLLIALAGLLLALSPITIIGGIGTFVLYVFLYKTRGTLVKGILVLFLLLAFLSISMTDCTSLVVSDNPIDKTLGRASCGVQVIYDRDLRAALNGIFYNDRLESAIKAIEFLGETKAMTTGMGLNSSSIFMPELYGEVRENSIWLSILLFYGVVGVAAFGMVRMASMKRLTRARNTVAVIFVAFFVCSTINSAGGFYGYSVLLWCITFALSPMCRPRTNQHNAGGRIDADGRHPAQ